MENLTKEQYEELKETLKNDFKREFGVSLFDEDFTSNEYGFEIDYRDPNLNNLDKYEHSGLVEESRLVRDGRETYIRVYAVANFLDYFKQW